MGWIIVDSFTFALVDWKRDTGFVFLREKKAIPLRVTIERAHGICQRAVASCNRYGKFIADM